MARPSVVEIPEDLVRRVEAFIAVHPDEWGNDVEEFVITSTESLLEAMHSEFQIPEGLEARIAPAKTA